MAILEIKKSNFNQEVLQSCKPVLIDFFATWCMPCKMLTPILDEIDREYEEVKVCRVDVESEPELAEQFQIMSIPTLVYLKDGKIMEQTIGFRNKETIQKMIEG